MIWIMYFDPEYKLGMFYLCDNTRFNESAWKITKYLRFKDEILDDSHIGGIGTVILYDDNGDMTNEKYNLICSTIKKLKNGPEYKPDPKKFQEFMKRVMENTPI